MSARDNIHFPNHIDLDEFVVDFSDKKSAKCLKKKYLLSDRQYRLVARYCREEIKKEPRIYKSPQMQYIYRNEYGIYIIRKRVGGVFKYFGHYRKLEDAIRIRNKLIENNWNRELIA